MGTGTECQSAHPPAQFDFHSVPTTSGPQGTLGITGGGTELAYGMVLKVGRQEIKFDNERVVGAVGPTEVASSMASDGTARRPARPGPSTAALTWDELNQTLRVMLYHRALVGQGNN